MTKRDDNGAASRIFYERANFRVAGDTMNLQQRLRNAILARDIVRTMTDTTPGVMDYCPDFNGAGLRLYGFDGNGNRRVLPARNIGK